MLKKNINAKKYAWEEEFKIKNITYKKPKGELVYLPIEQEEGKYSLTLVYKFDIFALNPISRDYVYVDASTGLVLKKKCDYKTFSRFI